MNNKNKYKIRQRIANQFCFSAEALYILADCVVFDQPKIMIASLVTKKTSVTLTFSFNEGFICENH